MPALGIEIKRKCKFCRKAFIIKTLTVFTAVRNAPLEKIALKNIFYLDYSLVAQFAIAAAIAIWHLKKIKARLYVFASPSPSPSDSQQQAR